MELLYILAGFFGGCAFAAWRLKGGRSMRDAVAVLMRGGGGGEER